jgi:hypothetical protein
MSGADAVDRDASHAAVAIDLGIAPDAGRHGNHVGQALQRLGIVQRQRPRAARQAGQRAAGLCLARMHADDVGAELGEFGQHVAMDALADRGQQDHRGDADGDAEQGQEAAQALRDGRMARRAARLRESARIMANASSGPAPDPAAPRAAPA